MKTAQGKANTRKGILKAWADPEKRRLRILRMRRGCKIRNSKPEYKTRLREANRKEGGTKRHAERSRQHATMSWKDPVVRRKRLRSLRRACRTLSHRQALSTKTKAWWKSLSDEEKRLFAEKVWHASRRRMNGLEKRLKRLSRGCYLRYVGNNKLILNGRCPDFVHKSKRKIVEVYGDYWHRNTRERDEESVAGYRRAGYEVLVIWEHEVYARPDRVRQRLLQFVGPS